MAGKLITERVGVAGDVSYLVRIRESGVAVNKTFKAKKEAEKFIREVKSKIDKGESVDITKIKKLTLAQIFDEYLKHNTVAPGKGYDLERLKTGRIQIRSATPMDSMNEGGMLRAVDQQLSVHSQR